MTTILTHPDHDTAADAPAPARRARWPWFGAVGAAAGLAAAMVTIPSLEEADYLVGVPVVDELEAGAYRVAFLLGLLSVGCLLVAAAGWRRWAEARAPRDLAARIIGSGLAVTATVNVVFFGITGALGLYLRGGVEDETVSREALFVYHSMLDFGSLLGWWGAAVAAVAMATVALRRRQRLLPVWMGVVSVVFLAPAVGLAVATSLPGFVGLTLPIWLLVVSVGAVFSRAAQAGA